MKMTGLAKDIIMRHYDIISASPPLRWLFCRKRAAGRGFQPPRAKPPPKNAASIHAPAFKKEALAFVFVYFQARRISACHYFRLFCARPTSPASAARRFIVEYFRASGYDGLRERFADAAKSVSFCHFRSSITHTKPPPPWRNAHADMAPASVGRSRVGVMVMLPILRRAALSAGSNTDEGSPALLSVSRLVDAQDLSADTRRARCRAICRARAAAISLTVDATRRRAAGTATRHLRASRPFSPFIDDSRGRAIAI